jgi:hypothetical protein
MTKVIGRLNVLTLVSEGKPSLGEFSSDLAKFATYGAGGKVDEIMLSGHGNAKKMELAGDKGVGRNSLRQTIYGEAAKEEVTVDPKAQQTARDKTDALVNQIKAVLRDDPASRVVLNACLTASNSVVKELDADPVKAAKQVDEAITADPSLATAIKAKLGPHQGQVLGANASFGQVGLLDTQERLDIVSSTDKMLTATKLEYAEAGTEATGVLRATLEAWAKDKVATIDALNRRLVKTKDEHGWEETVIRSLLKVVVANPDNGGLINKFATAAGVLSHLDASEKCRADPVKTAVPEAHIDAIFADLTTAAHWTNVAFNHIPLVVHQVWCAHDVARAGAFLNFVDASTFDTRTAADFLDLDLLAPRLSALLASPSASPPRGAFLVALSHFIGTEPPHPLAIDYIKGVVGKDGVIFPPTSNVGSVLKGKSEHAVLVAAGVVKKGTAPRTGPDAGATRTGEENVDPTRSGVNTVAVESVTKQAETYGWTDTNAYELPSGKKLGGIPSGRRLHIIGETRAGTKAWISLFDDPDVTLYAVEHTIGRNKIVFVHTKDVKVL